MKETLAEWLQIAGEAKRALGLDTILVFIGLMMFLGVIPSPLTTAHEEIKILVKQNQVIITGEFDYRHVECVNRAESDSNNDQAAFLAYKTRCDQAFTRIQNRLKTLGLQLLP